MANYEIKVTCIDCGCVLGCDECAPQIVGRFQSGLCRRCYQNRLDKFNNKLIREIERMRIHTVQPGESLSSIAEKYYGQSELFGDIAAANEIKDPDMIWIGQQLVIPEPWFGECLQGDATALDPPDIDREDYQLARDNYFRDQYHKDLIVLHHTAGPTAKSAYHTFANPGHVATSYLVGRKGKIFELFHPRYWAYHLGMKSGNPGHRHDKRSIGIEIVNVGALIDRGEHLYWWLDDFNRRYCSIDDTDKYVRLAERSQGHEYWATFSEEQYDSVRRLVLWLCDKYNIPFEFLPQNKRMELIPEEMGDFEGIATHKNFAPKYDVSPAFDWYRIINGVGK